MEKFNDEDGVWRTVRGRRIFIRDGESLKSAMSRSKKFNNVEKPKEIKKMIQHGNTFIPVRKGEDERDVIDSYRERNNKENIERLKDKQYEENLQRYIDKNNREVDRRNKLIKFAQDKDTIKELAKDFDREKTGEKVMRGEGITMKEFAGYISSGYRPGDVIIGGAKNGNADLLVMNNGKFKVINDYKKKKRSNH